MRFLPIRLFCSQTWAGVPQVSPGPRSPSDLMSHSLLWFNAFQPTRWLSVPTRLPGPTSAPSSLALPSGFTQLVPIRSNSPSSKCLCKQPSYRGPRCTCLVTLSSDGMISPCSSAPPPPPGCKLRQAGKIPACSTLAPGPGQRGTPRALKLFLCGEIVSASGVTEKSFS